MYCKHCGKQIADDAKFCEGCGKSLTEGFATVAVEQPKKKKKKHPILGAIVLIFGILLLIGVFAGGSDEPEKVGSSSAPAAVATEPVKDQFTVGDKVELNDIVVTLVDVSESNGANYMFPEDGKTFIICEFEIENNSDNEIAVSSIMSFEAYIDDYSANMDISAMVSANKSQLDGSVAPGKKMNGIIGYSADKDWESLEIRFTPNFWAGKDIIFNYSK